MKYLVAFFLSLFISLCPTLSQEYTVSKLTERWDLGNPAWSNYQLIETIYNEKDEVIQELKYNWDETNLTNWVLRSENYYDYDENDRLIKHKRLNHTNNSTAVSPTTLERVNFFTHQDQQIILDSSIQIRSAELLDTLYKLKKYDYTDFNTIKKLEEYEGIGYKSVQLKNTMLYEYNENLCLTHEFDIPNAENAPPIRITYEYRDNCLLQSKTYAKFSPYENEYRNESRTNYQYFPNNTEYQISETFFNISQTWQPRQFKKIVNNDAGLLVLDSTHFSTGIAFYNIFDYDGQQNEIYHADYLKNASEDSFLLQREIKNEYTYNENNWLITKRLEYTDYSSHEHGTNYETFDYYCDGLLRRETSESLASGWIYRTTYFHDELSTCTENKENFQALIFPNPAENAVTIQSNILSAQNNQINVYAANGRFIRSQTVDMRLEEFTLDLSNLPNGMYFIEVKNDQGYLIEKVIIAK